MFVLYFVAGAGADAALAGAFSTFAGAGAALAGAGAFSTFAGAGAEAAGAGALAGSAANATVAETINAVAIRFFMFNFLSCNKSGKLFCYEETYRNPSQCLSCQCEL
jgi:hypothetical protein